ncbi:MAG: hypothetical protein E7441_00915 [Ruminococcaceae bacterium]|nr:hypothetical protein [Oscillospiraceae bacterium]
MTTQNINEKIRELKELTRMAEEIEAEQEAIKDELKREMELRQVDEISTNEYKVRYKQVTSTRFDSTAFKSKYADLYEQFTKTTTFKRFSIA